MRINQTNVIIGVVILLLFAFPFFAPSSFYLHLVIRFFILGSLTLSWNLLSGYTRYINFGHAAFYGIGAYVTGMALVYADIPLPLGVLLGGIITALVALGVGGITLRIRGHYFAITTLLLLFIAGMFFANISDIIPGTRMEIWMPIRDVGIMTFRTIFYLIFLIIFLSLVGTSIWLEKSKIGYGLRAIRENEDVAESLGMNTTKLKIIAAVLSGFSAGIIGGVHAGYIQYINTAIFFSVSLTFIIVFVTMLGGAGSWLGPIVGTLLFVPVDELSTYYLAPEISRIIVGAVFVVVILLVPEGISPHIKKRISKALRGEK